MTATDKNLRARYVEGDPNPSFPALVPGQRVRLRPPLIEVELASREGTVVGPGAYEGWYRIRLDEPAKYWSLGVDNPLGVPEGERWEPIDELEESSDNVDVFDGGRWIEPVWVAIVESASPE